MDMTGLTVRYQRRNRGGSIDVARFPSDNFDRDIVVAADRDFYKNIPGIIAARVLKHAVHASVFGLANALVMGNMLQLLNMMWQRVMALA